MTKISVIKGDITQQKVDAIVNAANHSLLGGGGVDGAIHQAAGLELLLECETLGGCETGQAKLTKGYNLPSEFVIHTVGPIYGRENGNEAQLLTNCYRNSLELAKQHGLKTIAFVSISTGVYGYPKDEAVQIVHKTVMEFIKSDNSLDEIVFVTHSDEDTRIYRDVFENNIM